jgi:YVTN family beta-propeller protein
MRIKIRSVTVGSAALAILLFTSQQAGADSYSDMLSNISTMKSLLFVTTTGSNAVAVIDPITNLPVSTPIPVGNSPIRIVVTPDGSKA